MANPSLTPSYKRGELFGDNIMVFYDGIRQGGSIWRNCGDAVDGRVGRVVFHQLLNRNVHQHVSGCFRTIEHVKMNTWDSGFN